MKKFFKAVKKYKYTSIIVASMAILIIAIIFVSFNKDKFKKPTIYNYGDFTTIFSNDTYHYYKYDGKYYVYVATIEPVSKENIRKELNITDNTEFTILRPNVLGDIKD